MKGNARGSGYCRHRDDWYVEPRRAIDELLDVEPFPGVSYDPACGGGNIPRAFEARGLTCHWSDIAKRRDDYHGSTHDFLGTIPLSGQPDHIVTNPPYSLAQQFVLRGLDVARHKVAALVRLAFLEGQSRYRELFGPHPPARIWQFSSRISMPPGDAGVAARGGKVAFCWIVWDREHEGPPTLGWLP